MRIIIEKHNPKWKEEFSFEREKLFSSLNNKEIFIEHIGSTAVNGLGAKPVIDIMIGLKDFNIADNCIQLVGRLNYEYISEYEIMMPFRRFFH